MTMEKRFSSLAKGIFYLAGAVFLVWFLFQPSWFKNLKAEVTEQPYARTITVSGEGEVTAKPDVAVVELSVVAQGTSVKDVTQSGNERMNKVISEVKGLGVSEDDIKTVSYSLYPEYKYPENEKAFIAGYRLDQSLRVKIRDLTKVEDVVDKGVQAGANQVGQLSFEIDDDTVLRGQAREIAFQKAREKAESMVKAAGVNLGRVITFSEGGDYGYPQPVYARAEMAYDMEQSVAAPIEAGSQDIIVTMSVTYAIE